jgi:hypothetical protein
MALALGCSMQKTPARTEMHASDPMATACKGDGDCELVDEGCCSCNENGKRVAVLKGHAPKRNCEGVMCPQMMSNDPSCFKVARAYCRQGVCAITSVDDQEK